MTAARRKRLERLEARKPRGDYWRDPYDLCMRLWSEVEAVVAGRASWIPQPEPALSPEAEQAFALAMRAADSMAARLAAERKGTLAA